MHRILILLLYYDRPRMVRNALQSVLRANEYYQNWELAFIDDSSPRPGRAVAEEILAPHLDKVVFYHSSLTWEEKMAMGGHVGKCMNEAIASSNADVAIMLCDDDELCATYLAGLNSFFVTHPNVDCCYSHIHEYNPAFELSEFVENRNSCYNANTGMINPHCRLDAAQVAWRTRLSKSIKFPWPQTKFLDASFYYEINQRYPDGIPFTGLVGQYKGVHAGQLVRRDELIFEGAADTYEIRKATDRGCIYGIIWRYGQMGMFQEARRICKLGLEIYPDDQLLSNSLKFNEGE